MFRLRVKTFLACTCLLLPFAAVHAEDKYFDSNGVKIRYIVEGKGEPVLLIHGFTASIEIQWGLMSGIRRGLAKKYQVIAFDNRGHGKSGKPHDVEKYGPEMVEDAVRLLDHLKIDKVHVVGYSMGAMLTSKLLVTHPDRLLTATLGGAGALRKDMKVPLFDVLAKSLEQGKGVGPLIEALTPPDGPKLTAGRIRVMNTMALLANDSKALAAVVRSWNKLSVSDEQLKANRVPVLAMVGAQDPLRKNVDELKGRLSCLEKIVIVPNGDHIDAPAQPAFMKNLLVFLGEHAAKKRAAPARVVLTGKCRGFTTVSKVQVALRGDEDIQKELAAALKDITATGFQIDNKMGIAIALPKTFNINDAFQWLGKPVAVEGILTSTDDTVVIPVTGIRGAKRIPLLIAKKVTPLEAKNKEGFPAENHATIEGVAIKAETKLGRKRSHWAIENADGRIRFTLPKTAEPPREGARIRVSGRVRVVEADVVVDASRVEVVGK
jgi:pimeloyl-ACP methyl ester carboxylesterase